MRVVVVVVVEVVVVVVVGLFPSEANGLFMYWSIRTETRGTSGCDSPHYCQDYSPYPP